MNTIKTLALATIIIGMASCASTQKSRRTGNFPWIAPAPLTKYLSTTFRI